MGVKYRLCMVMAGLLWLFVMPANGQRLEESPPPMRSQTISGDSPSQVPIQEPAQMLSSPQSEEEASAPVSQTPVLPDVSSSSARPIDETLIDVAPTITTPAATPTVDIPAVVRSPASIPATDTPTAINQPPTVENSSPPPPSPPIHERSDVLEGAATPSPTPAPNQSPNQSLGQSPNQSPRQSLSGSSDLPVLSQGEAANNISDGNRHGDTTGRDESLSNWSSMITQGNGSSSLAGQDTPNQAGLNQTSAARALPHDLSPYGMFMQADLVVKSVMIVLAAASILTWIIWLAKSIEIVMAKRKAMRAGKALLAARSLAEAIEIMKNKGGVAVRLVVAASEEVRVSLGAVDGAGSDGLKERINSHLYRIEVRAGRVMSRGTGILATIGAVAPFVGLFGTVWGIMNSFIGISQAQTTNLAVVAPGIAEALLATAIGLVAAIPAVIIFNMFARSITVYRQMLADVSASIERLVSRDLDFRLAHKRAGKPALSAAAE